MATAALLGPGSVVGGEYTIRSPLEEGGIFTVTVGFDILDQLPLNAALVSSTIASDAFNSCVVRTPVGQTINAAGPDGKGHVVPAFHFVPN